jgi:DinB superfamily
MATLVSHEARIADLLARLGETTTRFITRLEQAGSPGEVAHEGWSAAQIAWHVAHVNDALASTIEGSAPGAGPAPEGFTERPWPEIVATIPARNQSPARFVPPAGVSMASAVEQMRQSAAKLSSALSSLTPERARLCITNRTVGTISLYQAGEFAIAHMIRHNQQAKRVLAGNV